MRPDPGILSLSGRVSLGRAGPGFRADRVDCVNENLLFTISGRKHQIRNNKVQMNIDKTTLSMDKFWVN